MAIIVKHTNDYGQTLPHYWRYNGCPTVSNRQPDGTMSVPTVAIFRGYDSEQAFKDGRKALQERQVTFTPSSSSADLAAEAYAAFKAAPAPAELTDRIAAVKAMLATSEAEIADAEADVADAHTALLAAQARADKAAPVPPSSDVDAEANEAQLAAKVLRSAKRDVEEATARSEGLTRQRETASADLARMEAELTEYTDWQQAVLAGVAS